MANLLVAQLLYLDSIDQKKDITMYINSPGGSVTAGVDVHVPAGSQALPPRAHASNAHALHAACAWHGSDLCTD